MIEFQKRTRTMHFCFCCHKNCRQIPCVSKWYHLLNWCCTCVDILFSCAFSISWKNCSHGMVWLFSVSPSIQHKQLCLLPLRCLGLSITKLVSATPLKLLNWILINLVWSKNIIYMPGNFYSLIFLGVMPPWT